ncbi:uncharacterized protein LOC118436132 [Folsomia candida]|uniref:uncharacterized protein LOC118436132 n=1 Tax=Folsomia candida TaxID=158441 RepID=UPI001604BD65|nr:uncharacterized protein LOC118436132 [Folsomia candida]
MLSERCSHLSFIFSRTSSIPLTIFYIYLTMCGFWLLLILTYILIAEIACTDIASESVHGHLPFEENCLLHFIDFHQPVDEKVVSSLLNLSDWNLSTFTFSFLISSANRENPVSTDNANILSVIKTPQVLKWLPRWRGSTCYRLLIWNAREISDVMKEPLIAFFANSKFAETFIFVKRTEEWDWDDVIEKKDSGLFNGATFPVVFIILDRKLENNPIFKMGMLCYMCPPDTALEWRSPPLRFTRHKEKSGHKRKMYLKYVNDVNNLVETGNCEFDMYFTQTHECLATTVLLQIIKTRLNLTVEKVDDIDDFEEHI